MAKYKNPNQSEIHIFDKDGCSICVAPFAQRSLQAEAAGHKFIIEGEASHYQKFVIARQLQEIPVVEVVLPPKVAIVVPEQRGLDAEAVQTLPLEPKPPVVEVEEEPLPVHLDVHHNLNPERNEPVDPPVTNRKDFRESLKKKFGKN